jgi:hypothetical protein
MTYVQEKATVESEIQRAKADWESARKAIPEAKERLARIKALLTNHSASDFVLENNDTALVFNAENLERICKFALEQAESKKEVLEKYTKSKTVKELNSEVEKTRSDELARQATWELENAKLTKVKRMTKRSELAEVDQRILSLVQKAYPLQAAIEAKRDQLLKGGKPDPALETVLRDLTNQLESLVDQAEREWEFAKARKDRQKKLIQRQGPSLDEKPILALIERAIPIEEQIREKRAQLAKGEKFHNPLPKEIQDLTNELRAIVDEAEAVWSAGELARLKSRIEEAARPANPAAAK